MNGCNIHAFHVSDQRHQLPGAYPGPKTTCHLLCQEQMKVLGMTFGTLGGKLLLRNPLGNTLAPKTTKTPVEVSRLYFH